ITQFLFLNFSFMIIQMIYSFKSRSLGLFSDSLHMLLDCSSLAIGLFAKFISKKFSSIFYNKNQYLIRHSSTSYSNNNNNININNNNNIISQILISKYPFGLSRIENLAAFINGILLLSIVQDIFFQSIDRILNPISLVNVNQLLIVSILGLVVNLVGIFAFNHGHDGHSHGHSHAISHSSSSSSSHSHSLLPNHLSLDCIDEHCNDEHVKLNTINDVNKFKSSSGSLDTNTGNFVQTHSDENMRGIFLHILADTLGSVGVVISTIFLIYFPTLKVLDPFSSLFIIVLIFLSSLPLIKSSCFNLLLILDDNERINLNDGLNNTSYVNAESLIRELLHDLYELPGVLNYSVVRIWKDTECELIGYIHIQYPDGENSTIIRKRCEKLIFEKYKLKLFIQLENESSSCWCRNNLVNNGEKNGFKANIVNGNIKNNSINSYDNTITYI
ncbi:metal cation transporter MSC2 ASCRUDRAFT_33594, partial [Ascoidea rubescens DSM 1968]